MKPVAKNRTIEIIIHSLIWSVFFIFLIFFSPVPREIVSIELILKSSGTFLFFFALIFYINYFILIEKLIFNKKIILFIIINILLIAVCALLNDSMRMPFHEPPHDPHFPPMEGGEMMKPNRNMMNFMMAVPYILSVVMSVAVKITQGWYKAETERKEAENKNLEAELMHLRYQIQPHFFFNSLNNIYSLIASSPEKAQEAVHSLSKLMRYLLYETGHEKVELSQEIIFLKKYIELMELRLTDKTKVTAKFPIVPANYKVAPLLFIPLIENAYKHGVSATQPSFIFFEMTTNSNKLYFLAENSNFPKVDSDKSDSGIGLENLEKRLTLLYKGNYEFKKEVIDGVFRARLIIEIE